MKRYWCHLSDLAEVHLGYKSLQNEFFYLSKDTIDHFGIEEDYLTEIFRFSDFDTQKFFQSPVQSTWLFYCRKGEADLRGTGALKYIRTMAKRPATMKKQASGKHLTIQNVLEQQSGGRWYAPKALPQAGNIWLRKAFAGIFAPFLFSTPATVDQRCNRLEPKAGISWKELAALMTTTLFPLALEADGACSMGAGALEWKTKSLRGARIIDLRRFATDERLRLVRLAEQVWNNAVTTDFSKGIPSDIATLELDEYVLELIGKPVLRQDLYSDLHSTSKMRIEKAKTRKLGSRVQETANVKEVAVSIATLLRRSLEAHRFPEDFYPTNRTQQIIEIPSDRELTLTAERFMTHGNLKVEDVNGTVVLEVSDSAHQVEIITRALMLGRRRFSIPVEEESMSAAIKGLFPWLDSLNQEIEEGVNASALGTRFESQLKDAVLNELRITTSAFASEVWGTHHLSTENTLG
jgi:hypothetical protein